MKLSPRESQIVELLLQGYESAEMCKELGIASRTLKHHFNRMFMRFGIETGIKRVKLAVMAYREQNKACGPTDKKPQ